MRSVKSQIDWSEWTVHIATDIPLQNTPGTVERGSVVSFPDDMTFV